MSTFFKNVFFVFAYFIFKSPKWFKEFLAVGIGTLWFDVFRIRRQVALENIKKSFPTMSLTNAKQIARSSLIQMGRTLVDFNTLACIPPPQLKQEVEFEGLNYLNEAHKHGKGVLLLSSHMANVDFGILALSNLGYQVHLISKRFTNPWMDDVWFSVRSRFGTQFIAPRKSSYEILKALKSNSSVIFVLDQFMGPPLGVKTVFFGRETGTAMGLALFAQKTGAPVVPCYSRRTADGRYRVCFEPEVPFEDFGDKNKNVQYMTQKYTDRIEAIVRKYPEQWMWIHRRWKVFRE